MNERVLGFVEEWIPDHVPPGLRPATGGQAAADALARQCLQDAAAQGISAAEITDAIDDLAEFMAAAIEEANERESHHSQTETEGENG